MSTTTPGQFVYMASGVGVGGRITDPPHGDIPAQASTMLPPDGGSAEAHLTTVFNFHGIVVVEGASTVITGNPDVRDDGTPINRTVTTTTVNILSVEGVVTANTVVAQLVSEQPPDPELRMRPVGHFTNLRIRGIEIDPLPHDHLLVREKKSEIDACREHLNDPALTTPTLIAASRSSRAGFLCSIFDDDSIKEQVDGKIPGAQALPGGHIHVDNFGDIYLGQYFVGLEFRRLTMLRIVLGSPAAGPVDICSVEGDGHIP